MLFLALLFVSADARTVRAGGPIILKFSVVVAMEAQAGAPPDGSAELAATAARPVPWCLQGQAFNLPYASADQERAYRALTDRRVAAMEMEGRGQVE